MNNIKSWEGCEATEIHLGATKMSFNRWLDKYTVVYPWGGGVLNDSVGKESTYNAEEPVDMGLIPG